MWDSARSGAKIVDTGTERSDFPDIYPALFTPTERDAFLDRSDESAALKLYGEIPSTFPTILGQVAMLKASGMAPNIDIALVDGGINDVNIEDIVNPLVNKGHPVQDWDQFIKSCSFELVKQLLQAVRDTCPKAVIMYFGFFPGASYASSSSQLKAVAKHEFGDDFFWWLNRHVYECADTDKLIHEVQTRGLWFVGRWQYWTRQAVNYMAMDTARRGKGIIYVPSTFGPENAAFAPKSFLWQGYEDPTVDDARPKRLQNLPRYKYAADMVKVLYDAHLNLGSPHDEARKLLPKLDGPTKVLGDMRDYINGKVGGEDRMWDSLGDEVHRIQHGAIASLAHPNREGAKAYAASALARYADFLQTEKDLAAEGAVHDTGPHPRIPVPAPVPAPTVGNPPAVAAGGGPIDALLTQCRLRTSYLPLVDDVHHLNVDSLAVIASTANNSEINLGESVFLVLNINAPLLARVLALLPADVPAVLQPRHHDAG